MSGLSVADLIGYDAFSYLISICGIVVNRDVIV